ncbi:MAG: hypothetical protein QM500_15460 [Methylococcales bacterium]
METFLLISAIIVTLTLLIAIHRLNNKLARFMPTEVKTYTSGHTIHFVNVAGKWLTFTGGIATFPLVMALIFMPEASADWISTLGVFGCLALILAALLLIPACIGQCLSRKVSVKRIVISFYHVIAKKVLKLAGYKTIGLVVGATLLALFVPFIANLLAFIVYVFGALAATKLGLLDSLEDETDDWIPLGFLDYSTDKWEDYGSTAYRLYHDD